MEKKSDHVQIGCLMKSEWATLKAMRKAEKSAFEKEFIELQRSIANIVNDQAEKNSHFNKLILDLTATIHGNTRDGLLSEIRVMSAEFELHQVELKKDITRIWRLVSGVAVTLFIAIVIFIFKSGVMKP